MSWSSPLMSDTAFTLGRLLLHVDGSDRSQVRQNLSPSLGLLAQSVSQSHYREFRPRKSQVTFDHGGMLLHGSYTR